MVIPGMIWIMIFFGIVTMNRGQKREATQTAGIWAVAVTLTDGEIKFRANDDWAINLGDTDADGSLEPDGTNIASTAGNYVVQLNLSTPNEYTYTVIPNNTWGLIGSATPDAWNSDQDMIHSNGVWTITLDLIVGEMKFRADNDWPVNYGGTDGSIFRDGANIAIAEAGNYTVTLNLMNNTYTVTKNEVTK